jgi:hypothetical protein
MCLGIVLFIQGLFSQSTPLRASTLSGEILEKGSKAPILNGSLLVEPIENTSADQSLSKGEEKLSAPGTSSPSASFSAETDLKGHYQVLLPEGVYRVVAAGEGYRKLIRSWVKIQKDTRLDFFLERESFTLPEVVVSTDKHPPDQVSQEDLTQQELTSVAGSVGDVMRAVQSLPGIINTGMEYSGLLVRGSGPDDNLYLVDRIPIGFPFHFGGAISTLDSSLVKDLDFATGGLNPSYGNLLGGLVDVSQRDPRSDRWGARVDVNLLMSEAEVEGPLTSDSSLVLAGRRSYLDLLIGDLSSNSFTAVPVFSDYQVKYSYNPSSREHWDFVALGAADKVGVNINGASAAQDPILGGNFNFTDGYNSLGVNYQSHPDSQDSLWNTLYHSSTYFNESFGGNLYLDTTLEDIGEWFTWKHDFDSLSGFETGVEYDHLINGTNAYFIVIPTEEDNPDFTATGSPKVNSNESFNSNLLGVYFNQHFKWFQDRLTLSLGARWDYLTYNSQALLSPRLSAAYLLTDQTTIKASYGYYEEAPSLIEGSTYLDPKLGNPQLGAEQSIASVVGVDQKLDQGLHLRVEGYEKDFSNLIVSDPVLNYNNEGSGYARGVEFFLRREPTDRFFGWISYSFSDSQRQDYPGEPIHVFDFDEPNVLNLVGNYKINPGWEVGFKWIYSSGQPYTPVTGPGLLKNSGGINYYLPPTGAINSARLPDYARLDLSTSLTTVYNTWQWRIYVEIINALNNQDVLGYQYNYDYSNYQQPPAVKDLPFLPYAGVEVKY